MTTLKKVATNQQRLLEYYGEMAESVECGRLLIC